MNFEERDELIKKATERRHQLLLNKGKEYAKYKGETSDINFNFKEVGRRLNLNPLEVCAVYLEKAILSIEHWIVGGELSSGETIFSRLDDARNYLDILETLICEYKEVK